MTFAALFFLLDGIILRVDAGLKEKPRLVQYSFLF